jgi:hypothetical protein
MGLTRSTRNEFGNPLGHASRVEEPAVRGYSVLMSISLRRLAHSHCLRTMAVLAWLMLVSTSLLAAPMLMGTGVATQTVQTPSEYQHQDMTKMQLGPTLTSDMSCCNDFTFQGCNCHSLCGSVLSPVAVPAPAPVMFATTYVRLFDQRAPAPNTMPPLRPPSA